jgi:hypothetical protein
MGNVAKHTLRGRLPAIVGNDTVADRGPRKWPFKAIVCGIVYGYILKPLQGLAVLRAYAVRGSVQPVKLVVLLAEAASRVLLAASRDCAYTVLFSHSLILP